jgi:hypothetical protein
MLYYVFRNTYYMITSYLYSHTHIDIYLYVFVDRDKESSRNDHDMATTSTWTVAGDRSWDGKIPGSMSLGEGVQCSNL